MTTLTIEHIVSDPGHRGGRPRIAGAGVTVQHVAEMMLTHGWSADDMVREFDLTLGQVHAALSYYYDHKAEIDASIQADKEQFQQAIAAGEMTSADDLRKRIEARMQQKANS